MRVTGDQAGGDQIALETVTDVPFGPPGKPWRTREEWTLVDGGRRLAIHAVAPSFSGKGDVEQTLIYDRR